MLGSEFCSGGEEENARTDELGLSGNEVEGDERQKNEGYWWFYLSDWRIELVAMIW